MGSYTTLTNNRVIIIIITNSKKVVIARGYPRVGDINDDLEISMGILLKKCLINLECSP